MKKNVLILFLTVLFATNYAQTSVGIVLLPTGTDPGIGFRTGKNSKWLMDARAAKANFYDNEKLSTFTTEVSAVCRLIRLEKVRFHMGIGVRTEWNIAGKNSKLGCVVPIGVEAFPFPFQNAGLFFETAPFFTHDFEKSYYGGLRTVAGFVFYFPTKEKKEVSKIN